ncbi:MAG: hypothetical protein LBN39_03830 [Planctomycetaceae bacterium]|nr:hypothetical protein [Planctomycetaceae bacterium]
MNRVNVRKGDCFFIPAGTVHALGAGILVAEVQTVSDLTFRLFDWNRLDANGNPRELHLEPGIQSIHTPTFPIRTEQPVRAKHKHCEQMLDSPWFSLDRWTLDKPILWNNDERCHIWTVLEGSADAVFTAGRRFAESVVSGRAADPDGIETLNRGDTLLIPAVCQYIRWVPEQKKNTVLLDVTVKFI